MPFPASSGLVSFSKQGLCEDTPAEHWGWLDLSCGWRRGGSTGTACCAWSFAPMASVLVLEEVPQLPLSLCCTSHSHETVTRPPCVGPVLPQVGNSGHFWDVNHLEGVWQLSELQACARSSGQRHTPGIPVGRDVGAGDAGAGGGSVLDVESVCLSVAKQKPQTSSRGFAGGPQRSGNVLEDSFVLVCAGVQDPWAAASPSGPKATSATCPCLGFPICAKPGGDIFPQRCSARGGLLLGQGSRMAILGLAHVCSSLWSGCKG